MSNNTDITCNSFLGKGQFGCVFKINVTNSLKNRNFALKVNFKDSQTDFIPNICEIDILRKFRDHPFLINVQDIYRTDVLFDICSFDNFGQYVRRNKCSDFHFTFPISDSVLDNYCDDFHGQRPGAAKMPILHEKFIFDMVNVCQNILIALEFLHNNNVIHSDVKLDNVLLFIHGDKMQGVLTDLGLASYNCKKTPLMNFSIMPSIYRPPELLLRDTITEKIDIWGFANIAYECFAGNIFTLENYNGFNLNNKDAIMARENSSNSDAYFLGKILYNFPHAIAPEYTRTYNSIFVQRHSFEQEYLISEELAAMYRPSFKERFRYNPSGMQYAFQQTGFTYDILDNFLQSAFTFNYSLRPSAETLLKHKLFEHESFSNIYSSYRKIYPYGIKNIINDPKKIMVKIKKSPEREIMTSYHRYLLEKYLNSTYNITFRVIMHSMQHCDQFLYDVYSKEKVIPFTQEELFKYMIAFVFMSIKIFNINKVVLFEEIFEEFDKKTTIEFKDFCKKFEPTYIQKRNYCFFKPTVLETLDFFLDESRVLDNEMKIKIFNFYASSAIRKIDTINIHRFTEHFISTVDLPLETANAYYNNPEFYEF